ncbi:MAG: DUF4388 domain-containing protein [bacterium]
MGDEAVFRMLALKQGDIFMQSDFQVEHHTVTMSWQDLLFEGIKRADESRLTGDEEPDDDTDLGMGIASAVVVVENGRANLCRNVPAASGEECAEIETAGGNEEEDEGLRAGCADGPGGRRPRRY